MRRIKSIRRTQAEYEKMDIVGENLRTITCSCGKVVKAGEGVKISFLHTKNGFVIRHKCYCTYECAPEILKSK